MKTTLAWRVSLPPNERRFTPIVLDRNLARPGFDHIAGAAVGADSPVGDEIRRQQTLGRNSALPLDEPAGVLQSGQDIFSRREALAGSHERTEERRVGERR